MQKKKQGYISKIIIAYKVKSLARLHPSSKAQDINPARSHQKW